MVPASSPVVPRTVAVEGELLLDLVVCTKQPACAGGIPPMLLNAVAPYFWNEPLAEPLVCENKPGIEIAVLMICTEPRLWPGPAKGWPVAAVAQLPLLETAIVAALLRTPPTDT